MMALAGLLTDLLIVMRRFFLVAGINITALVTCAILVVPCTSLWYMNGVNVVICISFGVAIVAGVACLFLSKHR